MQGPKPPNLLSLIQRSTTTDHLKQIHSYLHIHNLHQDQFLLTNLIKHLSTRFQSISYALSIFKQTPNPNTFLLNAIIQAFSDAPGLQQTALSLYTLQMQNEIHPESRPNGFTFPPLLKACAASFSEVKLIQELHTQIKKLGVYSDVYVGTTLVDSYSKCGEIEFARKVFDEMPVKNLVSWNSMISGLAKCGEVEEARGMFERMPEKNLVSWTCLISGYAQNGYFCEALEMFERMENASMKPNEITLASVLSSCANSGALGWGRRIHSYLEDNGYEMDFFVGSALIDMYSKCGIVEDAMEVFRKMPSRNVVSYSTIISGLAMNGRGTEAIGIFEDMRFQGMLPNDITFTGVLCACCHAGLVEKGHSYFRCMTKEFSITPKLHHYACMVDLLGRAGHLDQASKFIAEMPIAPDVVVWGALLGACRMHGEFKLGVDVAHRILELEPNHSGAFVFLSNAFARAEDWDGVKKMTEMIGNSGTKRTPGKSWIEVNNVVHQFFAGDSSHPQSESIYRKLDELAILLEVEGYKHNVDSVSWDVEEEEKEQSLNVHSEKLAIAFGLISTPEGTLIRVVKNLRVCGDCHAAIKLISKVVGRDIIIRDRNRFHHFTAGVCSCKDYW